MTVSSESLNRLAADTGFRIEFLEKVDQLVALLQALFHDPFLASRLALKGGTALNLFHFDLPRLSVDNAETRTLSGQYRPATSRYSTFTNWPAASWRPCFPAAQRAICSTPTTC